LLLTPDTIKILPGGSRIETYQNDNFFACFFTCINLEKIKARTLKKAAWAYAWAGGWREYWHEHASARARARAIVHVLLRATILGTLCRYHVKSD